MSEYIVMKSKAISVYDYKKVDISQFIPEFKVDEKQLEKDITRMLSAYGKKISAETVAPNDQIELSCVSENPKFNKEKVFVLVGKGLYSRELEEKITGLNRNEEKEITVGGDKVKVCVRNIIHTELPELNDENVSSFGIEGVNTVSDFRRYCIDKQLVRFLDDDENPDMAVACISNTVMDNSEFQLDEAELKAVDAENLKRIEKIVTEQGFSLEDINDDTYIESIGSTFAEFKDLMEKISLMELKSAVAGYTLLSEKNELFTVKDYDECIERRAVSYGISTEQARNEYSVTYFAIEMYAEYHIKLLDDFVAETIKRAVNP